MVERITPIIDIKKVNKYFPGVHALNDVDFNLFAGEVHALVGENGAGKSTLIKVIAGAYEYSDGDYYIDGETANIKCPLDAIEKGISVIYQELNLTCCLSVAENIFFGRLPEKKGRVLWKKLNQDSKKYLEMVGLFIDPSTKVQHLSVAQQQLVEIAKAISLDAKVIIMDEPTSALSPKEIDSLFKVVDILKKDGVGIVYVSHKLDEIFKLSERITVLRDGKFIDCVDSKDIDETGLIEMMVGREMSDMFPVRNPKIGEKLLDVKGLTTEKVSKLDFEIRRGEIVGFSGLMGAGRTEMTKALFGLDHRESGSITMDGKIIPKNSPLAARAAGMGLVPENRKEEGIFPSLSVMKNMSIVSLDQISKWIHIESKKEKENTERFITDINIKTPSKEQLISKLSGGNQQKVLLARWLNKDNLKLLIVDEPTRGIDVGAKAEIYNIIAGLVEQGLSVLMVSSELTEILGMCDRVYVMKDGKITGEFNSEEATEAKLLEKAIH